MSPWVRVDGAVWRRDGRSRGMRNPSSHSLSQDARPAAIRNLLLMRAAYLSFVGSLGVMVMVDCSGFGVISSARVQLSLAAKTEDVSIPDHSTERW